MLQLEHTYQFRKGKVFEVIIFYVTYRKQHTSVTAATAFGFH